MRIPARYFPHQVTIEAPDPMGGGRRWLTPRPGVAALVAPSDALIVDQRPDAESVGQQIVANSQVILQPESWTDPGARVTIWPGTPRERVLSAARVETYDHDIAPNSVVMWLV